MDFKDILNEAFKLGKKALEDCVPTPVGFYSADLSGNATSETMVEDEGNCGGAYIRGIKYNSEIQKFFKRLPNMTMENGIRLSKDVYKGYTLHFPTYNFYNGQSHERKKAFYDAACAHLRENGVECSVRDYLT